MDYRFTLSGDDSENYDLVNNYGLIAPIIPPQGKEFSELITISSEDWEKLAAIQIRRFQSKECQDGINWDLSNSGWENIEVTTLTAEVMCPLTGRWVNALIGAIGLEVHKYPDLSLLCFCWVHPFWRGRGLVGEELGILLKQHRPILIEEPISKTMDALLKKLSYDKTSERLFHRAAINSGSE